ncbi:MAG: dynamin family protein [Gemmatimonadota bacterium]
MSNRFDDEDRERGGVALAGEPLSRVVELAEGMGARRIADDARALAERVAEGRFNVACIGQFKRGKSTLLNALVGAPVLPAGVVPVTAVPTILRYGPERTAVVRFADGRSESIAVGDVAGYVAEDENPGNAKGIEAVEIMLPAPILHDGMSFVDTPGLGSVFEIATGMTHAFIPHVDAALVVVGADPPISADEVALAKKVSEHVNDLVVVLTKADRVSAAEREEAEAFTRRILADALDRPIERVFEVSAQRALQGGEAGDWRDLVRSLVDLAASSRGRLVRAASDRGLVRLASRLKTRARDERESLLRPVEESERRLTLLSDSSDTVEQRLMYLGHMLAAEQEHVSQTLRKRREEFLAGVRVPAFEQLHERLAQDARRWGPIFRRRAAVAVRELAESLVDPWLREEEKVAASLYDDLAARFIALGNNVLDELQGAAGFEMDRIERRALPDAGLHADRRFYFKSFETEFVSTLPGQWVVDALGPHGWVRRRVRRSAQRFVMQLLETNTTRVRIDLEDRVRESRRVLEREVRTTLEEARRWASEMIDRTRALRESGEEAVRDQVARLARIEKELDSLMDGRVAPDEA